MFTITRFLNVSAVVNDLDSAVQDFADIFGLVCAHRVTVPEMACDSAILPVGGGVSYSLELVEPIDTSGYDAKPGTTYSPQQAEGILRRFVDRRGEGLYRLAFEVEDFDAAVAHLEAQDVAFTYYDLELPTGRNRVAIVHPRETSGVMFEFLALGDYEVGSNFAAWPKGETGIFKRFLNTSCAVPDLDATLRRWNQLFGIEVGRVEDVPEMAARSAILRIGGDNVLEAFQLLPAPADGTSSRYNAAAAAALERYFAKRGSGLYRLALEVQDYDATLAALDRHGRTYTPFDLELETGPLRVAVLHPKQMHGIMFELCEPDNPVYAV